MSSVRTIYRSLSPSRRVEIWSTTFLLVLSAVTETLSIGAILPFLAVLTNPSVLARLPLVGGWISSLPESAPLLTYSAVAFIALAIVSGALRLILVRATQALAFNLSYDIANACFSKLLRQDYHFYVRLHSADLIARFEKLHHLTFSVFVSGIQAVVGTLLGLMIMLFLVSISPMIALLAGGTLVILYLVISIAAKPTLQRAGKNITTQWVRRTKTLQEALGGIRDVILDRSQAAHEREFRSIVDEMRRSFIMSSFLSQAPRILVESIGIVAIGVYVWILAGQKGGIAAAIPTLGALALGAQRLLPQLQIAYVGFTASVNNASGLSEVAEMLTLEDKLPPLADVPKDTFSNCVRLDCVSFAYPGGPDVLTNVSLTIERGERVGITGSTGSGKSTLMDLLLGLLEPTSGEIRVDGKPLTGINRALWQAGVAHVPQSIYLTDDTLAANIAVGLPAADRDERLIRLAARQAGIAEFIENLPQGYDTVAGERGMRLSGGQRQRIGIARALYRQPRVLILDEATSALDTSTESAVMASIDALGPEMTVIMIAHRLTTLENCGRLLHVEGGRVMEMHV